MYINGQAVTDTWFNPGNEEYRARMPYQTYDVTELLIGGENAMEHSSPKDGGPGRQVITRIITTSMVPEKRFLPDWM